MCPFTSFILTLHFRHVTHPASHHSLEGASYSARREFPTIFPNMHGFHPWRKRKIVSVSAFAPSGAPHR
jgi:hypothetical protein